MIRRRVGALLQCAVVAGGCAVAVVAVATSRAGASGPADGAVLGFGNDAAGQLGSGVANDGTLSPVAAKLPAGVQAVQVAAGYSHTIALGSDGLVYAWGSNDHGELGTGVAVASKVPTPVSLPSGVTVTAVSAGYLDSFAVTSSGAVYAWGYGGQGELGTGGTADATTPVLVHLPAGVAATSVSAGYAHVLAATSGGAVYAWGANSSGQLGDGTVTARTSPVKATLPSGTVVDAVSAGYAHSLALTSTGAVYSWGSNSKGQLGTGSTATVAAPAKVALGTAKATSIAAGFAHGAATLADGSAVAWGDNSKGQLGVGKTATELANSATPVPMSLDGATVTAVGAGFAHTLLRTSAGSVLATGDNSYGELGTGDRTSSTAPVPVSLPAGAAADAVATSSYSLTSLVIAPPVPTTTALRTSAPTAAAGEPVTFTATVAPNSGAGAVSFTAAGDPLPGCADRPLRRGADGTYRATCSTAALPAGSTPIGATYAGAAPYRDSSGALDGGETVVLRTGSPLAWGGNAAGQLGDGTTTSRTAPVRPALPSDAEVVQVAGGSHHALALLDDGSVYAWGDNTYGELGDGSTSAATRPVRVGLPDGVVPVSVAAGAFTSAVVAADGELFTWGLNNAGQLGDGTTTDRHAPVPAILPAGTVVTAAALGTAHLLALTSTGAVLATGGNSAGQLGTGGVAPASTPVYVHLPSGVFASGIAAGYAHSLAVTSDGGVLAWGDNAAGELGNGTTTPAVVPVAATLPVGTTVASVAAGRDSSVARATDGGVLTWGSNASGQLGTGSTGDTSTPAVVTLPGGAHATAVAAGTSSTYALTSDGAVLAWGDNAAGELGDGTTADRPAPVLVHVPAGGHPVALEAGATAGYAVMPRLPDATTVTSSANPSTAGKAVTFTATVSPSGDGGTMTFTTDGEPVGGCADVAVRAGSASCSTSALAGGNHEIVARYSGDVLYAPSSGALAGGQTVNLIVTKTKITASASKIQYTKSVTFTATVTGSDGVGTVQFAADGVAIAGCATAKMSYTPLGYQSKCATTALSPGYHVITATYSGNATHAASTGTLSASELVTVPTKLVASAVKIGDPAAGPTYRATLTAQADGTPVAGMTVTFALNSLYGTSKCTAVTDASGVAQCQGARPRVSGGQYTAKFAGTDVYLASSGSATVSF